MKTNIKVIYGFDPQFKKRAFDKLLTYNELKLLRCTEIPYMAKELKDYAIKNGFKRLTDAWYAMPKQMRDLLKRKYAEAIKRACNEYMSARIEEDTEIRKILLKEGKLVDFNHTPKFYALSGYVAPEMYVRNWKAYVVAYAEDTLIDNSVFSVVYIQNGRIKFKSFGTGLQNLREAQKFWRSLSDSTKTCKGQICARVQGATFDLKSFQKTFKSNKIKVLVKKV